MNNENYTDPRWGQYWIDYIRQKADSAGKKIYLGPLKLRFLKREAAAARKRGGKADAPPAKDVRRMDASHPFYWAAFVLVGSPD